MSKEGQKTTCIGLDWDAALLLCFKLKRDGRLRDYLLVVLGIHLGLRGGDLLSLKWEQMLNQEEILFIEQKTGKTRFITVHKTVREALRFVYEILIQKGKLKSPYIFANRSGGRITIQYCNKLLHKIVAGYKVKTDNASTHLLRKTFGKRVWEASGKTEAALIYLSLIFNHSHISITKKYIGVTKVDIENIYLSL